MPFDINRAIRELLMEKQRVERLIELLEARERGEPVRSRRGRKSMSAEERQQVSERMHRYWQTRRQGQGAGNGHDSGSISPAA